MLSFRYVFIKEAQRRGIFNTFLCLLILWIQKQKNVREHKMKALYYKQLIQTADPGPQRLDIKRTICKCIQITEAGMTVLRTRMRNGQIMLSILTDLTS